MYDYALGGKDNYAVDRAAADAILKVSPRAFEGARRNRDFLRRAVRFAATEGVGQFLDIGAGLPTAENTHQVVHGVNASARVVYVDNDPAVLSFANALLADNPETIAVGEDLHYPEAILQNADVRGFIDFDRPVCLVLVAVLHFLADPVANQVVQILNNAVVPGSCLVISHATADAATAEEIATVTGQYNMSPTPLTPRTRDEISQFFDGFELADPGVVNIADWPHAPNEDFPLMCYSGVAFKKQPA